LDLRTFHGSSTTCSPSPGDGRHHLREESCSQMGAGAYAVVVLWAQATEIKALKVDRMAYAAEAGNDLL
jgi:hypothetical protein